MKILFFGGAFDPPHLGHLSILTSAIKYTKFDKIIIMPTGTPTHKGSCTAPFDVRKYLAQQAFCDLCENIEISDYEGTNFKDDYTYLTFEYLKSQYQNADIYMLIGGDSLMSLKSWRHFEKVISACTVLSFARRLDEREKMLQEIKVLENLGAKIEFIENDIYTVSSSEVRESWKQEKNIQNLVAPQIKDIIDEYSIYSQNDYLRISGTAKLLIKLLLDENRQLHTYNVEKLAIFLGEKYNIDTKKLSIAALLHDIMKRVPKDILLHRARQSDIITKINAKPMQTLHGYAAADYAQKELKINDQEILAALKSHTCGRKNMSDFEKIIYLSDMLCAEREFEGKDYLLSLAYKNLDIAMKQSIGQIIVWLKQNNKTLDTESQEAFYYFTDICKTITQEDN